MKRICAILLCVALMFGILVPTAFAEDPVMLPVKGNTLFMAEGLEYAHVLYIFQTSREDLIPDIEGSAPGLTIEARLQGTNYYYLVIGSPTQAGSYTVTCNLYERDGVTLYDTCSFVLKVLGYEISNVSHTAFYDKTYSFELVDRTNTSFLATAEGLEDTGLELVERDGKWFVEGTPAKMGNISYTARLYRENESYREFRVTLRVTNPLSGSSVDAKTGESFVHRIDIVDEYYAAHSSYSVISGSLPAGVSISDSSEGLKISGTPTEPGSYVIKLNINFVDGQSTTHTVTIRVKCGQHIPEDMWYADDTTHWRFCTICDNGIDMGEHVGGIATCNSPAICDICNEGYGNTDPQNHDIYGRAKADWEENYHTHHNLVCDLCGETVGEDAHSFGPLTERNTRYCIVCWYETEPEGAEHTCSGGYATCVSPAICDICDRPYGETNPENHDIYGRIKDEADIYYHTHHDLICDLCSAIVGEDVHDFGPLTERNTRYCIVCWYETEPEAEEHTCSGGYATCVSPAICDTCNQPYGDVNPENHDIYGYPKAEGDANYHTHHNLTCDLCKEVIREEEHTFGPLNGNNARYCIVCWYETEPAKLDANIKMNHALNLASDISINFAIAKNLLAGYDMETVYVEFLYDLYEGNELVGSDAVQVKPVLRGSYYYFIFDGVNATMMNNDIRATFYGVKDGQDYMSATDVYSVATYAYAMMETTKDVKLLTLCADLLRYGAEAQKYKGYRTDALADAAMTEKHRSYLSHAEALTFATTDSYLGDLASPEITWVGKTLDLNSKVGIKFVFNTKNYTGDIANLSMKVSYAGTNGVIKTVTLTGAEAYGSTGNQYSFTFYGLLASELRTIVDVAIYEGETQLSETLRYSAESYASKNTTGTLAPLCKALFAYSDSANAFFAK